MFGGFVGCEECAGCLISKSFAVSLPIAGSILGEKKKKGEELKRTGRDCS